MKTLFSILFLIATELSGQELPELNKKILQSAEKLIGQKIGEGICYNLIEKVLTENNADVSPDSSVKEIYLATWNSRSWEKGNVYPGDVFWLKGACDIRTDDSVGLYYEYYAPNHGAIISKVLGKNKYEIIEQNVNIYGMDYESVRTSVINIDSLDFGKIFFLRPYSSHVLPELTRRFKGRIAERKFRKKDPAKQWNKFEHPLIY